MSVFSRFARRQPPARREFTFRLEIPERTKGAEMRAGERLTLFGHANVKLEVEIPNEVLVVTGRTLVMRGVVERVEVDA